MASNLHRFTEKLSRGFYDDASFLNEANLGKLVLNSFTGADIKAYLLMPEPVNKAQILEQMGVSAQDYTWPALKQFAELETISISSARSVFPVRRLGEHHVHRHTRGSRTISGTMVFTTFSRDVFAEFYRLHGNDGFFGPHAQAPFFVDQIPPFHLLLSAANEYGVIANAALINVELSNWGTTLSIHDLKIESTYSYVAQFFFPFVQDSARFLDAVQKHSTLMPEALSNTVTRRHGDGGLRLKRPGFVLEADDRLYKDYLRRVTGIQA